MIDDEHYELASAYSDGELDDAERSLVENDPALLALANEIQHVRSQLQAQDASNADHAPSQELRSRQLAIAGAAFDERYAVEQPATPAVLAPVIDLRQQRRYKVLSMAAGFVIVAGVGAMAIRASSGSSDSAASSDSAESAQIAAETTVMVSELNDEAFAASDRAAELSTTAAAEAPAEESAADDAGAAEEASLAPLAFPDEATLESIITSGLVAGLDGSELEGAEPNLDGCALELFPAESITTALQIERGSELLELVITSDGANSVAHLIDRACLEIESLEIEPAS